jgi:hypothetical protein
MCTGQEKLQKNNTAFEDQLQFVSDAVMAFAHAVRCVLTPVYFLRFLWFSLLTTAGDKFKFWPSLCFRWKKGN